MKHLNISDISTEEEHFYHLKNCLIDFDKILDKLLKFYKNAKRFIANWFFFFAFDDDQTVILFHFCIQQIIYLPTLKNPTFYLKPKFLPETITF